LVESSKLKAESFGAKKFSKPSILAINRIPELWVDKVNRVWNCRRGANFRRYNNPNKGGRFMRKILILTLALLVGFSASSAFAVRSGGTLNTMAPYGGDRF
jgi:hypothetical protein